MSDFTGSVQNGGLLTSHQYRHMRINIILTVVGIDLKLRISEVLLKLIDIKSII